MANKKGKEIFGDFNEILCKFVIKTLSDDNYSRILAAQGSKIPSDESLDFELKLPDWADHDKIKR